MRAPLIALIVPAAAACLVQALAVIQAQAGEARPRTIDVSRALDAALPPGGVADIVITPTPADPPPLVARTEWVFDLRWDRGDVWLNAVHTLTLAARQSTPRAMGRFALELFEGPALIERVRFDFPLLGASDPDGAISLARKLRTRIGVVFPVTPRGNRLELVDRTSGRRWSLPWPPSEADPSADGGLLAPPRDASLG